MKTFRFKLYSSRRNIKLHRQIDTAGLIYNHCIALHKRYRGLFHRQLNSFKLKSHLVKLKRSTKFHYLSELNAQAVQDVVERIERAYALFRRNRQHKVRCSPPNFKKVRRYKSFTLKQNGWKLDEATHTLTVGDQRYRYFQSRRIRGRIKTVTIKRDAIGDIYVFIVTDAVDHEAVTRTGKSVGYDFGLKIFLTASDSNDIISPLFFERNAKRIAQLGRSRSLKAETSKNYQRARCALARRHKKAANQRHDFHFKLAHRLCMEYETICLENLNIKGMQRFFGRKIGDLAFSDFVQILKYEATKFGTSIVEVDRFFASSQICHCCGEKNRALRDLRIRRWTCPHCGAKHDRDRNAAINILKKGLGQRPLA